MSANSISDKERILMHLINRLVSVDVRDYAKRNGFPYACADEPVPGDLVIRQSSGRHNEHPWVVGFAASDYDKQTAALTVREIGSDRECRVSNDSFYVVKNIGPDTLLTGQERKFYLRVIRAFGRGGEWGYRYGGVSFGPEKTATIMVREAFGGLDRESIPFAVTMKWDGRTGINTILKAMRDGGYGTRKFESRPKP